MRPHLQTRVHSPMPAIPGFEPNGIGPSIASKESATLPPIDQDDTVQCPIPIVME